MSKQIIIDYTKTLTRIGILSDGSLSHMYMDSPMHESVQDRIVVGQVDQVVKNLKGAFIRFDDEKNGLLHFKQVPMCYQNKLQQGAKLPVQIKKENTGEKGHKLTSFLNIQGYYLVCMLFEEEICISKKIKDSVLRQNIKETLHEVAQNRYGFMVRTKAQDVSLDILVKEAMFLMKEADQLMQTKDHVSRGTVLLKEPPLYLQVLMDHMHRGEEIELVTNQDWIIEDVQRRLAFLGDSQAINYKLYPYNENLFKIFSLEKAFDNTLKHKVWLKNGGNIVVDYTEAMTVIDVNSAKAIGTKNQRKAILDLNKLAVEQGILQILQRNLAGITVLDLVDLKHQEDKQEIFEYAKQICQKFDRERMMVYPITEIGLLQITRTKKYNSMPDLFKQNVESMSYQLYLIEEHLRHLSLHAEQKTIFIQCSTALFDKVTTYGLHELFESCYGITLNWQTNKELKPYEYKIKYHQG